MGGATVARSSRRRCRLLGDRGGCSAVNDSRETHTLALARPPPPSGIQRPPRQKRAPSLARSLPSPPLPDSPWSRGPGARGPRLARHGDPRPPHQLPLPCPRVHSAFPTWGRARLLNETWAGADLAIPLAPLFCFIFLPQCRLAPGPERGRPAAAAVFPPVDATAADAVPFQRMPAPRRAPEMFYSRSARGAGRGYPIPIPRVCVGLSGALGGNQLSCLNQARSGGAGARRLSFVWGRVRGAAPGKTFPRLAVEGAERRGRAFLQLVLQTFKGTWGGGGELPSGTFTQAPAVAGEGWLGRRSFPLSGGFH